jgi:prevent-host-death family protein
MNVNVTDAKGQLLDLVRRAEDGEEIILMRRGEPVVRLTPVRPRANAERRRSALAAARGALVSDISAASSQDFLYDENGMPA